MCKINSYFTVVWLTNRVGLQKYKKKTDVGVWLRIPTVILAVSLSNDVININRLTPNDPYMGRTAPLTSKRCIWDIYSTNRGTEYFKRALYCPFFLFKMQFVS